MLERRFENPYRDFPDLYVTCVDESPERVAADMERALNDAHERYRERSDCIYPPGYPTRPYTTLHVNAFEPFFAYDRWVDRHWKELLAALWMPWKPLDKTGMIIGDCFSGCVVETMSRLTQYTWVNIAFDESTKAERKCKRFEYFAEGGEIVRKIALREETSGWRFETLGDPLPFEGLDAYLSSDVSQRLTREMVASYVAELGYPIATDEFWKDVDGALLVGQEPVLKYTEDGRWQRPRRRLCRELCGQWPA